MLYHAETSGIEGMLVVALIIALQAFLPHSPQCTGRNIYLHLHVQGLTESFVSGSQQWRPLYDSAEPHKMQLPHGLHLLPAFKKLLILRCIRCV